MGVANRRPHVLKHNQRCEIPTNVVVFDTETDSVSLPDGKMSFTLRLGWAVNWRYDSSAVPTREKWVFFRTGEEFWEWVESTLRPHASVLVIAHNVDFDVSVTGGYRWLYDHGYKLTDGWEESARFWHVYKGPKGTIKVMDSLNLFPMPLKVLGDSLGLEKLEVDFATASDEELSTYCKRDVEIVMSALRWLWGTLVHENLGCWSETLAKQAMHCWLHKFLKEKVVIHACDEATQLERRAYHGGRVECFRIGKYADGPYYLVDVNSMYPYVMREHEYPCELIQRGYGAELPVIEKLLEQHDVIADVEVEVDEPVFPYMKESWVCYPTGYMRTTLTSPELKYALEHGWVKSVGAYAVYRSAPIFREYVEYFWEKRKEAKSADDKARMLVYKLLMNSLYGKLGQYVEVWHRVGSCDFNVSGIQKVVDVSTGKRGWLRYREGVIEEYQGTYEGFNSMAAIPATVTAYARMYLWELIKLAGVENVYYVDTDSLIVTAEGLKRLEGMIDPLQLGKLKLEKSSDELVIRGPKDYIFAGVEKIKGIRKSAVQVSDNQYVQERWHGYKTRLREGLLDTFVVSKCQKSLDRTYRKGIVGPDGVVKPYHLRREDSGS